MTLYEDDQGTYTTTQRNRKVRGGTPTFSVRGSNAPAVATEFERMDFLLPDLARCVVQLRKMYGSYGLNFDPVDDRMDWAIVPNYPAADGDALTELTYNVNAIWSASQFFRVLSSVGVIETSDELDLEFDDDGIVYNFKTHNDLGQAGPALVARDDVGITAGWSISTTYSMTYFEHRIKDDKTEYPGEDWEEAWEWGGQEDDPQGANDGHR